MTREEAEAILKELRNKAEEAFCEDYGVERGQYHEARTSFILGFMQASFVQVLVDSYQTVLS